MAYSIKSKKQEYQIMLGKKISDAGATSVIYSVKGNDSVVYKEYKKESKDDRDLERARFDKF